MFKHFSALLTRQLTGLFYLRVLFVSVFFQKTTTTTVLVGNIHVLDFPGGEINQLTIPTFVCSFIIIVLVLVYTHSCIPGIVEE
jgi:hypothetical protein